MIYNKTVSWRAKILLILCGAVVILFVFHAIFNIGVVNSITDAILKENLTLLTSIIENALTSPMVKGKLEIVEQVISNIPHNTDIISFKVISTDGKILSSSSPEEVGHEAGIELKESMRETAKKGIPIFFFQKMPVFFQVKAIKNEPRCYGCHSPSNRVNGFLAIKIDYRKSKILLERSIKKELFVLLFALFFMVFLITIALNKLVNRPVITILEKMKEVETGNLSTRIEVKGRDEIANLGRSFNLMVDKLEKSIEEREKTHTEDLRRAEHLANLGELAAGLTHEIKNPLTGIKGAIEVILENESGKNREILSEILNQINRISDIIQNFLTYARPKEPSFTFTNIHRIVEDSVTIAKYYASGKKIEIETICPSNIRNQYLDPDQIQQVLVNLLINSIDSIEDKGKIEIRVCPRENGVDIRVIDNGRGINEEILPFIFKPFFTTKSKGSGLGLAISKRLIENHKGRISVESKQGLGTLIRVFIPFLAENGKVIE
ncbi:MAG: sensor histidine kinase [Candidatus Aminicenantia bacterium]